MCEASIITWVDSSDLNSTAVVGLRLATEMLGIVLEASVTVSIEVDSRDLIATAVKSKVVTALNLLMKFVMSNLVGLGLVESTAFVYTGLLCSLVVPVTESDIFGRRVEGGCTRVDSELAGIRVDNGCRETALAVVA